MFQSTPPVAEGRCAKRFVASAGCIRFNPRPPLPRGDARRLMRLATPETNVSIHAPRCRGAMPCIWQIKTRRQTFQSTPPVAEGRCEVSLEQIRSAFVSIHAPRCRGAMPPDVSDSAAGDMFQSTPPVAEGRCAAALPLFADRRLVSIHAPRCRGAMRSNRQFAAKRYIVSIHAPRCRGAMRRLSRQLPGLSSVSIHAPRCRGAMRASGARR